MTAEAPAGVVPDWFAELRAAAASIDGPMLSRFLPPQGMQLRRGAVLMLFGEPNGFPEILLTERAHTMRSHPGQVSFPGGSLDPGESPEQAALREAEEETGLDAGGVDLAVTMPDLWIPVSNFSVTPVLGWWREPTPVGVVDPVEVHQVHQVALAELLDPQHRITARHPSGFMGPAFLIGPEKDVVCWGFTAGILARLFDHVGWSVPWNEARIQDLPTHMLPAELSPDDQGLEE
ncbi:MAG: CoA pyrophosphatase [Nocardioides sp.]